MIFSAQEMEDNFGQYFDKIIVNTDLERTFDELIKSINELEARPQWVKACAHIHYIYIYIFAYMAIC